MRFRFTIRELLWLTVVMAMAIGWWLDHRKLTQDISPRPSYCGLLWADAKSVQGILQRAYVGQSDISFSLDARNNAIVVSAPPRSRAEILFLLKQFDVASASAWKQAPGQ